MSEMNNSRIEILLVDNGDKDFISAVKLIQASELLDSIPVIGRFIQVSNSCGWIKFYLDNPTGDKIASFQYVVDYHELIQSSDSDKASFAFYRGVQQSLMNGIKFGGLDHASTWQFINDIFKPIFDND